MAILTTLRSHSASGGDVANLPLGTLSLHPIHPTASYGPQAGFIDLFSLLQGGISVVTGASTAQCPVGHLSLTAKPLTASTTTVRLPVAVVYGGGSGVFGFSPTAPKSTFPVQGNLPLVSFSLRPGPIGVTLTNHQFTHVPLGAFSFVRSSKLSLRSEHCFTHVPRQLLMTTAKPPGILLDRVTFSEDEFLCLLQHL